MRRSGAAKGPGPAPLALFALPPVQPRIIEEVWVQCDRPACKKWRKLPLGVKAPPDNVEWYCSMNPDPLRNGCDIPEEDYSDDDWEAREEERKRAAALGQPAPALQPKVKQPQLQLQPQLGGFYGQQQHAEQLYGAAAAAGAGGAARRRRGAEPQGQYAADGYEWDYPGAGRKRRRTAVPQQLPRFFASQQEEEQQLQLACQRILDNGGLWDPSPAPGAAALAASGGAPAPAPSQLGLPLWVWNGLHTHAPDAASILVEALDLLTSSCSLGMQAAPAGGAGLQQQPQQLQSEPPPLGAVEQRWRFARVALLAAAAATLAALGGAAAAPPPGSAGKLGVVHAAGGQAGGAVAGAPQLAPPPAQLQPQPQLQRPSLQTAPPPLLPPGLGPSAPPPLQQPPDAGAGGQVGVAAAAALA